MIMTIMAHVSLLIPVYSSIVTDPQLWLLLQTSSAVKITLDVNTGANGISSQAIPVRSLPLDPSRLLKSIWI